MSNTQFSDLEGLKIAVEMERRGGDFYRRTAKVATNPKTVELLEALARDEEIHEKEFHSLAAQLADADLANEVYDEETSAYLSAVAADVVFQKGLMALVKDQGYERPESILTQAIESEKDAIIFYGEMIEQARMPKAAVAFREIVRQEKTHLAKLSRQLLALLEEAN